MSDTKRINIRFQLSEGHYREGREPSINAKLFEILGCGEGGGERNINGPEITFILFNLQRFLVLAILPYINKSLY